MSMLVSSPRLFLVSTPLHLLVSIAIVAKEQLANCHLLFIDQVAGKDNVYLETLRQWPVNPFQTMDCFYRPVKKPLAKLQNRKQTFKRLEEIVAEIKPEHIYVGNDRRIEFQWCMHQASKQGFAPQGYYLDEGTFTYVGRKASFSFSDKYIDNLIKKMAYGFWWQHPPTVGASNWITTVYASFPELVHPLLKTKQLKQLSLEYWQGDVLFAFCQSLIAHIGLKVDFSQFDAVVTLPHESVIAANASYGEKVNAFIDNLLLQDKKIAVKYHPRDTEQDALKLADKNNVTLLIAAVPFEAMLPMLKTGSEVLGDFSTTLISSRLLRPDLKVLAIDHKAAVNREEFLALYEKLGIGIY